MRLVITTALLLAFISAGAGATVLVPADLTELTRGARTIARGRVIGVEARWLAGRRGIETIVTLAAESYLKGPLGPTVQFRVPGGQLGAFRNVVVGAPEFAEGQRVIVFLGATGPRVPWVLGMNQGVFRLVPDRGGWIVRGDPRIQPAPLATFERDVRALAGSR
jgi:hypothetical protein